MSEITITFPDKNKKKFKVNTTPKQIAESISEGLAREVIAAKVNDILTDTNKPIEKSANLELLKQTDEAGLEVLRHSTAHLLAQAVKRLHPEAKPGIGPVIEDGFYYDFANLKITEEDIPKIEAEMKKIVKEKLAIERTDLDIDKAYEMFTNPLKKEIIKDIKSETKEKTVSYYKQGDFIDLCRGPHIPNTKHIKAFKILKLSGAYWKGDSKNEQLLRIYGTSFPDKKQLNNYLELLEEAKKRDHKILGKQLDLYEVDEDIGPGLIIWLPNGNIIKEELENWAKVTEEKWGYKRITTPLITKEGLFHTSEHLPHYKDSMFAPMNIDGENYYIKPMNCPFHHKAFASRPRSYRDLPLRFAEYGHCHRYEQSGAISGLMRVRGMDMNDAHIYCTKEQAVDEFVDAIKLHEYYYKILGIKDYQMELALRDPKSDKYHGDDKMWKEAEDLMMKAMKKSGVKYVVVNDGAAFYGPKIDFQIRTVIGKLFTISTNQIDLFMPGKFNLRYTGEDGNYHTPVVIHRAPLGTHERFIGYLIEHFAGKFPLWLSPVQVIILPIADRHLDYSYKIRDEMRKLNIRVEVDDRAETTNRKVREAQLKKIPIIINIGDKEVTNSTLAVRTLDGNVKFGIVSKDLYKKITSNIDKKEISFKLS